MNTLCEEYLHNLIEHNEIMNRVLPHGTPDEEMLRTIEEGAVEKRHIRARQDELLRELLCPYESGEKRLDERTAAELNEFAQALSQAVPDMDNAIAFRVHRLLLAYEQEGGDPSRIVEQLYWCGIGQWKYHVIDEDAFPLTYFAQARQYRDDLQTMTGLGVRRYVCCCVNEILAYTNRAATPLLKKGQEILAELDYVEKTCSPLEFDMDVFRTLTCRNMGTAVVSFRMGKDATPENTELVLKLAETAMSRIDLKDQTAVPFETGYRYDYYTARFHHGLDDFETLCRHMDELVVPDERFSKLENYNRVFYYTSRYLDYLRIYRGTGTWEVEKKAHRLLQTALEYAENLKRDEESTTVGRYLFALVQSAFETLPFYQVEEAVVHITAYQHKPTCIHTLVVERLCGILLDYVLDYCPEQLVGILDDYTEEEIRKNRYRLRKIMRSVAILHDLGKYKCVSIISNTARALEEDEFQVIRRHPIHGYRFIEGARVSQAVKDGALYHHRWHNGQGGYPAGGAVTSNQPLIDILSVADSVDAATDVLGRTYAKPKTLDELIAEFETFRDTRYGGFVIDALKNPDVRAEVERTLGEFRTQVACIVYRNEPERLMGFFAGEF